MNGGAKRRQPSKKSKIPRPTAYLAVRSGGRAGVAALGTPPLSRTGLGCLEPPGGRRSRRWTILRARRRQVGCIHEGLDVRCELVPADRPLSATVATLVHPARPRHDHHLSRRLSLPDRALHRRTNGHLSLQPAELQQAERPPHHEEQVHVFTLNGRCGAHPGPGKVEAPDVS